MEGSIFDLARKDTARDEPPRANGMSERQLALLGRSSTPAPSLYDSRDYRRARFLAPVGTPLDDPLTRPLPE